MTDKELIKEFTRWVEAGKPSVWGRGIKDSCTGWAKLTEPCWNSNNLYYIVDDKYAELRKIQIDNPDTQFQMLQYQMGGLDENGISSTKKEWVDCESYWDLKHVEYRVKPDESYEDLENEVITLKNKLTEIEIKLKEKQND